MPVRDTQDMSCDDPDCPACLMEAAIRKIVEQGFDADDVVPLFFHALGNVVEHDYKVLDLTEAETMH